VSAPPDALPRGIRPGTGSGPDALAIREYRPEDREDVAALWRLAGFLGEGGADAVDEAAARAGARLLVGAVPGGGDVAAATIQVGIDARGPFVDLMALAPAIRGRGHEHHMLAAAAAWLAARAPASDPPRPGPRILGIDAEPGYALKALMALNKGGRRSVA
jgi:GNAT superfamily N-acetyltransferase